MGGKESAGTRAQPMLKRILLHLYYNVYVNLGWFRCHSACFWLQRVSHLASASKISMSVWKWAQVFNSNNSCSLVQVYVWNFQQFSWTVLGVCSIQDDITFHRHSQILGASPGEMSGRSSNSFSSLGTKCCGGNWIRTWADSPNYKWAWKFK